MSKEKASERSGKIRVLVLKEPYWGKQAGETESQFTAFMTTGALGPERTLAAVAQHHRKSEAIISLWSKKNKWQIRLEAWDLHKATERLVAKDQITEDEIRECAIRLMENDGSIESRWEYRELRDHEVVFTEIIRGLLNREYKEQE